MHQKDAIEAFAALAQSTRMDIFRLLVKVGPDGLKAGEISRRLKLVQSTLSGHLAILKRSHLLNAKRKKREIYYSANFSTVNELIQFLMSDCCEGQLENCKEVLAYLQD